MFLLLKAWINELEKNQHLPVCKSAPEIYIYII